jgi:hypothetical protein
MVQWSRVYVQKGVRYNSCPVREDLVEKDEAERIIRELCFLLQMIHDQVPHGPGIHKPIRDMLEKYQKE